MNPDRQDFACRRVTFWNDAAKHLDLWAPTRTMYTRRLREIYSFAIPAGSTVLELGCGQGDLLAAVRPALGVGVDFSAEMIGRARARHPELELHWADVHDLELGRKFDYIICSDLFNDVWDVEEVLRSIHRHSTIETRIVVNLQNDLWEMPRRIAATLRLAQQRPTQNWLSSDDLRNLLYLTGFEIIRHSSEMLCPAEMPLAGFANRYLARLWPFHYFASTGFYVVRRQPSPRPGPEPIVSVIVPARNEAGNIASIFDRTPQMGGGTELIFVEGNSSDDTYNAIAREIERRQPERVRLFRQPGKGKGDAVRKGFAECTGELLMILDADITVAPEDLVRFYDAWRSGRADFVNGVRLAYPMQDRAMPFVNRIANKFFASAFTWMLQQPVKDTLCGTKVISRHHYSMLAASREYFGDFDPFGDFDLLFGAAKYNLKIVDMPVRYGERVYGASNISRWSGGAVLIRMLLFAGRRLKFV